MKPSSVDLLDLSFEFSSQTGIDMRNKMLELTMIPDVDVSDTQFGFRKGRGTGMACSMLNDVISHCKSQNSPLFLAGLDAEKCFDSICHTSLFVKLIDLIPMYH